MLLFERFTLLAKVDRFEQEEAAVMKKVGRANREREFRDMRLKKQKDQEAMLPAPGSTGKRIISMRERMDRAGVLDIAKDKAATLKKPSRRNSHSGRQEGDADQQVGGSRSRRSSSARPSRPPGGRTYQDGDLGVEDL